MAELTRVCNQKIQKQKQYTHRVKRMGTINNSWYMTIYCMTQTTHSIEIISHMMHNVGKSLLC